MTQSEVTLWQIPARPGTHNRHCLKSIIVRHRAHPSTTSCADFPRAGTSAKANKSLGMCSSTKDAKDLQVGKADRHVVGQKRLRLRFDSSLCVAHLPVTFAPRQRAWLEVGRCSHRSGHSGHTRSFVGLPASSLHLRDGSGIDARPGWSR